MRKIFAIILCIGVLLSMVGCDASESAAQTQTNNSDTSSAVGATDEKCAHNFSVATCTEPSKCTLCGETTGSASGHSWKAATCTAPKTCSVCGATEGSVSSHNFSGSTCTVCSAKDPSYENEMAASLKKIERYPKYLKLEGESLLIQVDRYKITDSVTAAKLVGEMIEKVSKMSGYLQKIIDECGQYDKLYPLVSQCEIDIPVYTGSANSYVSDVKLFATRCTRIQGTYDIYAK